MNLPVAQQWFVRKKFSDEVTLITEPHVHPFLRCNIWHIRGRDEDLLIDTGMCISDLSAAATDLLKKKLVVTLTHSHLDHVGSGHEFECCHIHRAEEADAIEPAYQLPLDTRLWPDDILKIMAADGPIGDFVIDAVPHEGYDPAAYQQQPVSRTKRIDDGDVIDLGNRSFEVLHLPGHSPGSIGLWEKSTRTLFSGDAIYDGNLLDDLPGSDPEVYRKTMARLLKLPADVIHGGHGESFGREKLTEIATAYLQFNS